MPIDTIKTINSKNTKITDLQSTKKSYYGGEKEDNNYPSGINYSTNPQYQSSVNLRASYDTGNNILNSGSNSASSGSLSKSYTPTSYKTNITNTVSVPEFDNSVQNIASPVNSAVLQSLSDAGYGNIDTSKLVFGTPPAPSTTSSDSNKFKYNPTKKEIQITEAQASDLNLLHKAQQEARDSGYSVVIGDTYEDIIKKAYASSGEKQQFTLEDPNTKQVLTFKEPSLDSMTVDESVLGDDYITNLINKLTADQGINSDTLSTDLSNDANQAKKDLAKEERETQLKAALPGLVTTTASLALPSSAALGALLGPLGAAAGMFGLIYNELHKQKKYKKKYTYLRDEADSVTNAILNVADNKALSVAKEKGYDYEQYMDLRDKYRSNIANDLYSQTEDYRNQLNEYFDPLLENAEGNEYQTDMLRDLRTKFGASVFAIGGAYHYGNELRNDSTVQGNFDDNDNWTGTKNIVWDDNGEDFSKYAEQIKRPTYYHDNSWTHLVTGKFDKASNSYYNIGRSYVDNPYSNIKAKYSGLTLSEALKKAGY